MEQVFVVRREDFFGGEWPQGFLPLASQTGAAWTHRLRESGFFSTRNTAEDDPSLKQLIPYCIVCERDRVFVVRRRSRGTEARLHGCHSVGIGGHIGPEDGDASTPNLLEQALLRELHEELVMPDFDARQVRFLGLLNDDSNPVGRVHLGLVYRLDLAYPGKPLGGGVPPRGADEEKVRVREIHKLRGGFRPLVEIRQLWEDSHRFEGWSQTVVEALFNPPRHGGIPTSTRNQIRANVREE